MLSLYQSIVSVLHTENHFFFSPATSSLNFLKNRIIIKITQMLNLKKNTLVVNKSPHTPRSCNLVWIRWFIIAFNFIITILQWLLLFEVNGTRQVPGNALCKSLYPSTAFVYSFIFLRQLFSLVIFFTRYINRPTVALLHEAHDIS